MDNFMREVKNHGELCEQFRFNDRYYQDFIKSRELEDELGSGMEELNRDGSFYAIIYEPSDATERGHSFQVYLITKELGHWSSRFPITVSVYRVWKNSIPEVMSSAFGASLEPELIPA